jgi:hypothetical protein
MKIKIKILEKNELGQAVAGEPDGSQPDYRNMEEGCGCECESCQAGSHHGGYSEDQYGMSPNQEPDENGDGIISPDELYYHFDLNRNQVVLPDEYEQHVKWHCRNPEVFNLDDNEEYYELDENLLIQFNNLLKEKKDRCYRLAKQKYDVFPSAYASGFIVRCRKGKVAKKKK